MRWLEVGCIVHHKITSQNSEAAVQDISSVASVTATSISGYILLQDFVLKVNEACSVTNDDNGQQANLVLFLTSIRDKTWDGIRSVLTRSVMLSSDLVAI